MRVLFVFLIGLAVGAGAYYYYEQRPRPVVERATAATNSTREAIDRAAARTKDAAAELGKDVAAKLRAWHLTPEDIRAEVDRTGQVVRADAARAKVHVTDARIVAAIKAKLLLERDLSASAISVDSTGGEVVLTGTVDSEKLVGKAVGIAVDTDGVQHVTARLRVTP